MRGLALTLTALLAISSSAQEVEAPPDSCRISGVVLDPDGVPVRDLTITLYWYTYDTDQPQRRRVAFGGGEMRTGPEGKFAFDSVAPGFVRLYATIPGMLRPSSELQELAAGQALESLVLRSPGYGGSIVGTVVDEGGVAVEGAVVNYGAYANESDVVAALASAEEGRFSARTDADGWFAIDTIQPGRESVSVYFWGYPRLHVPDVEVVERGEVSLELVLQRALPDTWTLLGTVIDEVGAGIPGANVQVAFRGPTSAGGAREELKRLTTGDLGEFLASDLPPGATVFVHAHHPQHGMGEAEVTGEAGAYREAQMALQRGTALTGTAFSPEGEALPNTQLYVRLSRLKPQGRWSSIPATRVETDDTGRYVVAGLVAGEWTLRADAPPRRACESQPISVPAGAGEVSHDIRFPPGGTIAGSLAAPEDLSGSDARVFLYAETPRQLLKVAQLRDGTSFSFAGIEPGEYSLTATAMGFWPATTAIELPDGEDINDLRVEIGAGPTISGTVLDGAGNPVADAALMVDVRRAGGSSRPDVTQTLMYARRQVAQTGPDGRYRLRGVSEEAVALVVIIGRPDRAGAWEAFEPESADAGSVTLPLRVRQRFSDGTFAEAGGVHVSLAHGGNVAAADIQLAKWMPDEDLCSVRGRVTDPSQRLSDALPVQVALSEDPLGPGRVIQERRGLTAGADVATADEGGGFRVANVVPGEYYVVAGAGTDFAHVAHVELAGGQEVDLGGLRIPVAGALEGHVADAGGNPIAEGWAVAARLPHEARTMWRDAASPRVVRAPIAADGSYRIESLGPGFWFVMTAGDRLPGSEIRRVFIDGATERVDFRHAYAGRIAGRVVDTAGNGVPRAVVRCEGETYSWTPDVRSDDEGRYELSGLPVGAYTVTASRAGYLAGTSASVEVAGDGGAVAAELVLEPGAAITGTLMGPNATRISGRSREFVLELCQGGRRVSRVFLRDDGTFISPTVRPGTYTVRVSQPGRGQGAVIESEPVSVAAGETARDVVLEVPPARWRLPAPTPAVPAEPGTRRAAGGG